MLSLKHKYHILLALFGLLLSFGLLQTVAVPKTYADVTCRDGFKAEGAPSVEKNEICANHQFGDASNDPLCYSTDGKTKKPCDPTTTSKLESEKCYKEQQRHPGDSIETLYTEFPCPTATTASSSGGTGASCGSSTDCITQPTSKNDCAGKESTACGLFDYINTAIKLLSAMIGIISTILIIVGGIRYSAAGADPNAVAKAKSMIFKGVYAIVGFGLLFAVMEWLLPGGILGP